MRCDIDARKAARTAWTLARFKNRLKATFNSVVITHETPHTASSPDENAIKTLDFGLGCTRQVFRVVRFWHIYAPYRYTCTFPAWYNDVCREDAHHVVRSAYDVLSRVHTLPADRETERDRMDIIMTRMTFAYFLHTQVQTRACYSFLLRMLNILTFVKQRFSRATDLSAAKWMFAHDVWSRIKCDVFADQLHASYSTYIWTKQRVQSKSVGRI